MDRKSDTRKSVDLEADNLAALEVPITTELGEFTRLDYLTVLD